MMFQTLYHCSVEHNSCIFFKLFSVMEVNEDWCGQASKRQTLFIWKIWYPTLIYSACLCVNMIS